MPEIAAPTPGADGRLAALRRTALLDSPVEEAFDRLTRLAVTSLRAPVALIAFVDQDRQFLKSCVGLPEPWASRRETPPSFDLCRLTVESGQPLIVDNLDTHPAAARAGGAADLGVGAYAGAPLVTREGYAIGAFCVMDRQPRAWGGEAAATLADLAAAALSEIEQRTLVTTLQAAQQNLHRSEQRLQTLSRATRDVIFEYDIATRQVWWSSNFAWLFGYRDEEVNNSIEWWQGCLDPAERDKVVQSFERALQTGVDYWSKEHRFRRGDGTYADVFGRGTIIRDDGGRGRLFVGAFTDITQRKQAEEALAHERDLLQALMDNIPDTIYFKDTESRFTRINRAQVQVLGLSSPAQAVGKTDFDFWPRRLAEQFFADEQQIVQTGRPLVNQVQFAPLPDGSPRWFSATKVPLRDRSGRIVGLAGISRNITELKLAERDLQSQKQLFENLVGVARAAIEKPALADTLRNVLNVSVASTGAAQGTLILLDSSTEVTHTMTVGGDSALVVTKYATEFIKRGLSGWVARNRQTAWVPDTALDPRWYVADDAKFEGRSALSVPIISGADVLGVITLVHPDANHFSAADVSLMESAVDQMALALRNATMFEQARGLAEEMYALNQITRAALVADSLDELYESLVSRMGAVLGTDACFITAWDEQQKRAITKASSHPEWRERYREIAVAPGEKTLTEAVLETGRPIAVDDTRNTPYMSLRLAELFKVRSSLALPLIARNRKLGAIILSFEQYHHFTRDEIAMGERAARQVALALSNALLFQEMSEQHGRLEALIESSRDGIILIGSDTHILVCNRIAINLLGLPGASADWVGRPLRAALLSIAEHSPHLAETALEEARRVTAGQHAPNTGEHTVGQRTVRWIHLPVTTGNRALGRLVVLRDVTEERALEQLRDDLTHMMVHDLRSPLTVMLGATETLADNRPEHAPLRADLVSMIQEAAGRMLTLVDAILDTHQLEANRMPIERVGVSLRALSNEVLQLQAGILERKGITLENNVPANFPYVYADMRLLDRVLQNLLSNAIKFTPEGGVIRFSARRSAGKTHTLRTATISIFNSGPGIPAELQSRLFQKFVRGRQRGAGNGLGLAFCRLVIEAHDGHIWVESEPDKGATFSFTLPLYSPDE